MGSPLCSSGWVVGCLPGGVVDVSGNSRTLIFLSVCLGLVGWRYTIVGGFCGGSCVRGTVLHVGRLAVLVPNSHQRRGCQGHGAGWCCGSWGLGQIVRVSSSIVGVWSLSGYDVGFAAFGIVVTTWEGSAGAGVVV